MKQGVYRDNWHLVEDDGGRTPPIIERRRSTISVPWCTNKYDKNCSTVFIVNDRFIGRRPLSRANALPISTRVLSIFTRIAKLTQIVRI
jgi:hypothetical protein